MYAGQRSKPTNPDGAFIEYVNRKRERSNYTCTITPEGECYYMVAGKKLSEPEFNKMFPISLIDRSNGKERLDSRQNYF